MVRVLYTIFAKFNLKRNHQLIRYYDNRLRVLLFK